MTPTKVVSLRSGEPYDVMVTRPSPFGNPFSHVRSTEAQFFTTSRYEAVRKHAAWIKTQPALIHQVISQLQGKTICCACSPTDIQRGLCHAVTLAKIADSWV